MADTARNGIVEVGRRIQKIPLIWNRSQISMGNQSAVDNTNDASVPPSDSASTPVQQQETRLGSKQVPLSPQQQETRLDSKQAPLSPRQQKLDWILNWPPIVSSTSRNSTGF